VTIIVVVKVVTEEQDEVMVGIVEFAQLGEFAKLEEFANGGDFAEVGEVAEVEEFAKAGEFELEDHIVGFEVAADVENKILDKVSVAVVEAPVDVITVVSVVVGIRQLIVPY
jgi:hypothetical protein